ncbi:MAG: hypothetical protein OEW19_03595 [Acidobacteriota bacterium]|nr:hypothetical protein [Acidobacteriota bacterium]
MYHALRRAEARGGGTVQRTAKAGSWMALAVALVVVVAWPPDRGKSLALTLANWAVDPWDRLPTLPPQLGLGLGDDPVLVEARDAQVRHYDALYARGGWTRMRLQLKVADDPFDPATERQLLLALGLAGMFVAWRVGTR